MRHGIALLSLLLAASLLVLPGTPLAPSAGAAARGAQPHVVLILTDDMRQDDLRYMPFTRRLLRRSGTEFTGAISPHPLCCPARAELITGQYAQNNGVRHNKGEWGGYPALQNRDRLLFRWFDDAGYFTTYSGKLMNGYAGGDVPGLDHNDAAIRRVYRSRGVVTWNNGDPRRRRGHQTYYTTKSAVRSVRAANGRPLFMWTGYVAPHGMTTKSRLRTLTVPPAEYDSLRHRSHRRPPSMGKPSFNAARPYHDVARQTREQVKRIHSSRVRALYAVDDGVREIVRALKEEGMFRRTVLVFTSDNGMGMGSHRMLGKNLPYSDVLRVPLLMAGPGIPAGRRVRSVTTLVDLPGTMARLAGVTPMLPQDGGDLFEQPSDRAVLVQAGRGDQPWDWRGVYTGRYTYVHWEQLGRSEFYDRVEDPHELDNLPGDPRAARLRQLLDVLAPCAGPACAATFDG